VPLITELIIKACGKFYLARIYIAETNAGFPVLLASPRSITLLIIHKPAYSENADTMGTAMF
jgi:hypothetical protein